jgi:hypothetical protein
MKKEDATKQLVDLLSALHDGIARHLNKDDIEAIKTLLQEQSETENCMKAWIKRFKKDRKYSTGEGEKLLWDAKISGFKWCLRILRGDKRLPNKEVA